MYSYRYAYIMADSFRVLFNSPSTHTHTQTHKMHYFTDVLHTHKHLGLFSQFLIQLIIYTNVIRHWRINSRPVIQTECTGSSTTISERKRVQQTHRPAVNPLAPKDIYIRRTTHPTSIRSILNIYSTNILTEYFKHAAHSPIFLFKMPFISQCYLFWFM